MAGAVTPREWLLGQDDPKVRLKAACRILANVAAGLAHLHRALLPVRIDWRSLHGERSADLQVVHRDIWSQNVLLSVDPNGSQLQTAKLADFGTARWADSLSAEGFPAFFEDPCQVANSEPLQLSRMPSEHHGLPPHYSTCSDCFQFGTYSLPIQ